MSTAYLGRKVLITLNEVLPSISSFLVISGTIESINQQSNTLILINVTIGPKKYLRMEVSATQISSIEIIPEAQTTQTKSLPTTPKKKKNEKNKAPEDDLLQMDTFTKEFDFQANLNLFPKTQIFSELRAADNVPIKDRLVGHNLSQMKFRHDEMILGNQNDFIIDEDEEIFISSPQPSLPSTPKKSIIIQKQAQQSSTKKIVLDDEKIEKMVLEEYISVEQLISYSSQSSFFAVKDFITKGSEIFNTLIIRYSNDSNGAIALNCGRLLLDRFPSFTCTSSSSSDDGIIPSYIKTSLRQWQLWGGSAIDGCKIDSKTLILDSSKNSSFSYSSGKLVRFRKGNDGDLNLRFGIPHSIDDCNGVYVVCNAGYPRMALTEYNNLLKDSLFERI